MPAVSHSDVENAIKGFIDPYIEQDLLSAKVVKELEVVEGKVRMQVLLGFPANNYVDELRQLLETRIKSVHGVVQTDISVEWKLSAHKVQKGVEPLKNVKNIIAVASGKGGVGKSTVAANVALALSSEGASIGVLDADIYGPSQPRMLGVSGQPESKDGKSLEPKLSHGVQSMSIGYLIDEETPMIWRGPMVTQALEQLLKDTNWRDIDYLIVDLPPGTGDTQLTLAQKIPVSGAVIVTTPQDIALLDARKGLKMFEKVQVPVLGIIENMSIHICTHCGHEEHIFGEGGGLMLADQFEVDFLGGLPLDASIRQAVDDGNPTMVSDSQGPIARIYTQIARRLAAKLSLKEKDYSQAFPNIVIQNN